MGGDATAEFPRVECRIRTRRSFSGVALRALFCGFFGPVELKEELLVSWHWRA
jgi:hypothetical protein